MDVVLLGFVELGSVFSTEPRDCLGSTSICVKWDVIPKLSQYEHPIATMSAFTICASFSFTISNQPITEISTYNDKPKQSYQFAYQHRQHAS